MRRPGDNEDAPPGGRAAERLREQLRDRFGDDPAYWPEAAREQLEAVTQDLSERDPEQFTNRQQ